MFYVNGEPEGKCLYTETIKVYCIVSSLLTRQNNSSFSTGLRVERDMVVEREKVEPFSERVNVWMCVCVCAGSLSDSQEMPRASN